MKYKILTLLLIVAGFTTLSLTNVNAAYNPVSRNICTLMVKPFNTAIEATTGPAGDQFINYLNNECKNFLSYPNPYAPQPPQKAVSPLKQGAENKNLPITRHDHAYFNDTAQDENYFYKAFMDKFEITLQSDGYNSINLNEIKCQTPYPAGYDTSKLIEFEDCMGNLPDLWGGTTMTKRTINNKVIISWDFGQTPQNGQFLGRPVIWANNGSDFKNMNLTDETNRRLGFNVHLPSKDNDTIWSATTSSRALVSDLAIRKTNYPANDGLGCSSNNVNSTSSGWCYLPPSSQYSSETIKTSVDRIYYWYPIGTVSTIWREPEPIIPPLNVCENLKLNPYIKLSEQEANQLTNSQIKDPMYNLNLKTLKFSDNILPNGTQIVWRKLDTAGKFWIQGQNGLSATSSYQVFNPASSTAKDNQIWYTGKGPVSATVTGLPTAQLSPSCNDALILPTPPPPVKPPENICREILVDHNLNNFVDTVSEFKSNSLNTEGEDFKAKITYSVDPGYGMFYLQKPSGINANPTKRFIETSDANLNDGIQSILKIIENTEETTLSYFGNILKKAFRYRDRFMFASIILPPNGLETITVEPGTTVYFVGLKAGTGKIHVKTERTTVTACERNFDILALPPTPVIPVCSTLGFNSIPPSPLKIGQYAIISIAPKDTQNNALPDTSKIHLSTGAGGKFVSTVDGAELTDIALQKQFPITFQHSDKEGHAQISIDSTDPAYSPLCSGTIEVIKEDIEIVECKDLTLDVKEFGQSVSSRFLKEDKLYTVLGTATYSKADYQNTVSYEIDPKYGAFLNFDFNTISPIAYLLLDVNIGSGTFTNKAQLDLFLNTFGINESVGFIKQPAGKIAYMITFSNAPVGTIQNILHVSASNFSNNECQKNLSLTKEAAPEQCSLASIAPLNGQFNPANDNTIFNITGNYIKHQGYFEISVEGKGTVAKGLSNNYAATITFSNDEIKNSSNGLNFNYKKDPSFDPEKDIVKIKMRALGDPNLNHFYCNDQISNSLIPPKEEETECVNLNIVNPSSPWEVDDNDSRELFQIEVSSKPAGRSQDLFYTWKVGGNGNWTENGRQSITKQGDLSQYLEDFDEDTIVEVYDNSNRSICYDYLRARSDNKPSKENPRIQKVVYPENKIKDYESTLNLSSATKYLTYMIIVETGDTEKIKIFDSALAKLKNGTIKGSLGGTLNLKGISINAVKGNQYLNIYKDNGYIDDTDSSSLYRDNKFSTPSSGLANNYSCNRNSSSFCYEGKVDQALEFKNVDTLGSNGVIIIKYQMKINTYINDQSCKSLSALNGCGEEFNNTAEIQALFDNSSSYSSSNDNFYKDKDSAKVIVVCPYVLTRSGGDVFFYDVIDTGIDIAQCSPVKGHTGPGITPTPLPIQRTIKTGAGDTLDENLKLLSPSHDICRFSNLDNNIEGYNDALTHFSSTICEMQADVSESWQEKNINQAIKANITRITRWGGNNQNGVFLSDGSDFTIDAGTLEPYGTDYPAARTYIIKDADLIINSDIKYGETDYTNPKKIPSYAFIVLNGNIKIAPDVQQLDGIYMAVNLDMAGDRGQAGDRGKIMPTSDGSGNLTISRNPLLVNGSLIGNVYDLFLNRLFVGDPGKDEGSVVIRYDERILLNTPPGISELIDVKQAIVPN